MDQRTTDTREPTPLVSSNNTRKLYPLFVPASSLLNKETETEDHEFEVSLSSLARRQEVTHENENRPPTTGSLSGPKRKRRRDNCHSNSARPANVTSKVSGAVEPLQQREETKAGPKKSSQPKESSRIESKTSMAPRSTLRSSNNVVFRLLHRSVTLKSRTLSNNTVRPPSCSWTVPSSVKLDSQTDTVSCFAWDEMGVLLAVAFKNKIQIYDWDVVVAADMKHRRLRARPRGGELEARSISASFAFSIPYPVSCLCWNPTHPDQLAVAFRMSSEVWIFDVASVADTHASRVAPRPCLRLKAPTSVRRGVRCFLFLPNNHLMVSHMDGALVLWKIPKDCKKATPQSKWSFQSKEEMSAMVPLHSEFVLLGGINGTITLLNWRKCSRKAFSTRVTPTVVGQWDTYPLVKIPSASLPPRNWMGVQKIHVEQGVAAPSRSSTTATVLASQKITWITSCGWILSMKLRDRTTLPCVSVLQTSPQVRLKRADGEEIETETTRYSLPADAVAADAMTNCLCWQKVPAFTHILPHHDKRVLDASLPVQVVSANDTSGMTWMDTHNGATTNIHLPKRYGPAQLLAVHPSQEWIVFATKNRVRILNRRAS